MTETKASVTAQLLKQAKLDYETAQAEADEKKKQYEQLRKQLCSDMVNEELLKFEIPGLALRLETVSRYSPVVENKDRLIEILKIDAPDLFTVTAPTLSRYIADLAANNDDQVPEKYSDLVKCYDETHVVVRTKKI